MFPTAYQKVTLSLLIGLKHSIASFLDELLKLLKSHLIATINNNIFACCLEGIEMLTTIIFHNCGNYQNNSPSLYLFIEIPKLSMLLEPRMEMMKAEAPQLQVQRCLTQLFVTVCSCLGSILSFLFMEQNRIRVIL